MDNDLRELQRKADAGDEEARKALYRTKRRSGILPSWDDLRKHFADLVYRAEGPSKSTSGGIKIYIDSCSAQDPIHIELGTYDIGDWPRHLELGYFKTMEEARKAVADKLDEAEAEISREIAEDKGFACPHCAGELGGQVVIGETVQRWGYDPLYCPECQFSYYDCEECGKVYEEESDAGNCCA